MAAERKVIQPTENINAAGAQDDSAGKEAVQKIIGGNSELYTDTYCKVCKAVLVSEVQRLSHYQSKKHAKTVRRYEELHQDGEPVAQRRKKHSTDSRNREVDRNMACRNREVDRNITCRVCHLTFTSPAVAYLHYHGKNHALKYKLVREKTTRASSAASKAKNPTVRGNYCNLCDVFLGGFECSKQHLKGKKHKKREIKAKLVEQLEEIGYNSAGGYPCKTCHVVLTSVDHFNAHILGVKHKSRVIRLVTSSQRWVQWYKYGQKS
ncbi:zinc finger protein 346-like isoform X2 [Scyliorhinus canicula]|uniref:zinc finger protein 346-like isoform X2 n=1 Tax=Scyliorhinus canicula TaxID=7830 RepID=UPI0018F46ADA|nr:zinc finger protein 346-like isoform X2 [Scyliorhinus canicula]